METSRSWGNPASRWARFQVQSSRAEKGTRVAASRAATLQKICSRTFLAIVGRFE